MVVQLAIPVAEVDRLLDLGFTTIEVWRSTDEGNLYTEVTGEAETAAYVESVAASNTFRMGGRLLKYRLNNAAEVSVSFSSLIDYWTPTQVVNRINEVDPGRASLVDLNKVRITAPTVGRATTAVITYSDADDLGFTVGATEVGQAPRVSLVSGTFLYIFTDVQGLADDRYKWRFSANGAVPVSEFTERVFPDKAPASGLEDHLSVGSTRFVGADGKPTRRTVIVAAAVSNQMIQGFAVGDETVRVEETDDEGLLQLILVRGARVRVAIEGTTFARTFTVPDEPAFDLMEVMAEAPDPFTVVTPPPFLTRRVL